MRGKLNVVIFIQNYSGCFVDRLHSLVKMWHLLWCEKSSDCLRRSHHQQWRCRARQMCLDWMFSLEHLTLGLRPVVEWQTWHSLRPAGIKVQHKSQLQHLCLFLQLLPHSHRAAFSPSQDLSGGYMWLSCHPVVADCHSIALLNYFLILIHINSVASAFLHTFPLLYLLKLPPCLHHPPVHSEHMGSLPSTVSDSKFPSPSLGLPSATPSPSLGLPSAASPASSTAPTAASRGESSGPRSLPPHLGFPQSKDAPSSAPLTVSTKC